MLRESWEQSETSFFGNYLPSGLFEHNGVRCRFWEKFSCPGKRNSSLVVCDGTYRYRVFSFEVALVGPSGGWRYGKRFSVTYSFVFQLCSGASSYKEENGKST